jgi:thymidine kinase
MLIDYYQKAKSANKNFLAFKPDIDKRYSQTEIISHNGEKY